jgi:hypothetical protein
MSRVRRFFYVKAPLGKVAHIQFGRTHSEGPVKCGISSRPGWLWTSRCKDLPLCKRCEA